jgi:hypothetical protein
MQSFVWKPGISVSAASLGNSGVIDTLNSITEIQNLLSNSKVRNVIHSGRITFRVLTNYIPRLGELQSAVMANYNPRSQARPTP